MAVSQQGIGDSSGQSTAAVPAEVSGLNWGAFLLGWIWSAFNGAGILWVLIGLFFSPIDRIFLLFKGNELAWKGKQWESPAAFKASQRKWMMAGLIILAVGLVIGILSAALGGMAASNS